jgi:sterol desaturase/sphingolipid hydroxylase (fatty acid hydroxylase superfamily)
MFDDPGSRLAVVNIVSTVLIVFLWLFLKQKKGSFKKVKILFFQKKYWWNRSTKIDYLFYIVNTALKAFLFFPSLDISFWWAKTTSQALVNFHGDFLSLSPETSVMTLFMVFTFVWDDFLRFFQHFLMHQIPWLWSIHSVHHSAERLTPITLFRNHPLESAIATLRNSLSLGVASGVFIFVFEAKLSLWTVLSVNIFGWVFNLLGANLRHSELPIGFPVWLEKILISPRQHQIHHSQEQMHWGKNLGVSLAIWDHLTNSWMSSRGTKKLQYGTAKSQQNFWAEFFRPFRVKSKV